VSKKAPYKSKLAQRFEAYVMSRSSAVIAVSDTLRMSLIEKDGIEKVHFIPNGVNTKFFRPEIAGSEELNLILKAI